MRIHGKVIAEKIYTDLRQRIKELQQSGVTPNLAVILIGSDPGSVSYVRQKELHAREIGVQLTVDRLPDTVSSEQLGQLVEEYNADMRVHGVIIQRPAPEQISRDFLDSVVVPEKDVDGFHPNSDFAAPVALAVERILYTVFLSIIQPSLTHADFSDWILGQHIVVLGKGLTAGTPIITHFHNRNAQVSIIDSQTEDPLEILQSADIVISAVGQKDVLLPDMLRKETILIGVGLHTEEGKLRGDYNDRLMENAVAYYTPTPGGVGPVNVAMLMSNVVRAAEEQSGNE